MLCFILVCWPSLFLAQSLFTQAKRSVLIRSQLFFLTQVANIGATFGGTMVFTKLVVKPMERLSTPLCAVYFFLPFRRHSKLAVGVFLTHFFFHFLKSYPAKSEITRLQKKIVIRISTAEAATRCLSRE